MISYNSILNKLKNQKKCVIVTFKSKNDFFQIYSKIPNMTSYFFNKIEIQRCALINKREIRNDDDQY